MAMLTQVLLLFLGMFLMIVVLLQRGRGGGLAGAFGGMGGQSAFGTKAGDVFTKITVVIAVAWVLVAGGSGYFLRAGAESRSEGLPGDISTPADAETPLGESDDAADPFANLPAEDESSESETPATDGTEEADSEEAPVEAPADGNTEPSDDEPAPETPADDSEGSEETTE